MQISSEDFITLIETTQANHPSLDHNGYNLDRQTYKRTIIDVTNDRDVQQVSDCYYFLLDYTFPQKTINTNNSSYGLKHLVERFNRNNLLGSNGCDAFVSNGSFILAALMQGFRIKHVDNLNVSINISVKSIRYLEPLTRKQK